MPGLSQDPEKRERQLANLKTDAGPGRPKGSKNWSTVMKELLKDEELFKRLLNSMERKPKWLDSIDVKNMEEAISIAQGLKAMSGSHFSAEWVRKNAYGDRIDITSNGETIKMEPVVVSQIKPRNIIEGEVVAPKEIEDGTPA
jgi:hypothetical protein